MKPARKTSGPQLKGPSIGFFNRSSRHCSVYFFTSRISSSILRLSRIPSVKKRKSCFHRNVFIPHPGIKSFCHSVFRLHFYSHLDGVPRNLCWAPRLSNKMRNLCKKKKNNKCNNTNSAIALALVIITT